MTDYTEDVLRRLQDLLVLLPAETSTLQTTILTHDDQLFIFETAGLLITSGNFDSQVSYYGGSRASQQFFKLNNIYTIL